MDVLQSQFILFDQLHLIVFDEWYEMYSITNYLVIMQERMIPTVKLYSSTGYILKPRVQKYSG